LKINPNQLFLDDVLTQGALRKFTSPNRMQTDNDVEALWGCIDPQTYFASDHAPSNLTQKKNGSIWAVPFGLPGKTRHGRVCYPPQRPGLIKKKN